MTFSKASSVAEPSGVPPAPAITGIGEHDVELAEFFAALLDRGIGRRDVGGISDERERIGTEFLRRGRPASPCCAR